MGMGVHETGQRPKTKPHHLVRRSRRFCPTTVDHVADDDLVVDRSQFEAMTHAGDGNCR